jgi:putative restriction endonuclease
VEEDRDDRLRAIPREYVRGQASQNGGVITRRELETFVFEGTRFPLIEPQRGIRKAAGFDAAISFLTTYRERPEERPYDDRIDDEGFIHYKWKGTDAHSFDNRSMRVALDLRKPLMYFIGVAPGVFAPLSPVWIVDEEPTEHEFIVAADDVLAQRKDPSLLQSPLDLLRSQEYVEQVVKRRVHQPFFRRDVIAAYTTRCALCRLRHPELLDAAHIKRDVDGGKPVVTNGLAMCAIHHRAFDANLIGVRPDYVIEVPKRVLNERDGPTLRYALQGLHGAPLAVLPQRPEARPDSVLLEERYERFPRGRLAASQRHADLARVSRSRTRSRSICDSLLPRLRSR